MKNFILSAFMVLTALSCEKKITETVEKELKKGINKSFHQTLLRSIERVKELLKENPFAGDQVKKRQIPPNYIIKYNKKGV